MAKILVVDDDPTMIRALRKCLEKAGHDVFDAPNGEEGLRRLQELNPDLIILDVMMNTATEGFEVAIKLRQPDPGSPYAAYQHTPILVLTAIHSTTDLTFGPDEDYLPIDGFIDKPFEPEKLVDKVSELLARVH
jgi:CheY-like chemotaxis protein